MNKVFISERVVLYIEQDGKLGIFHDLNNDERGYINADTVRIIRHLTNGLNLNSFFSKELPEDERKSYIIQSRNVIQKLITGGFLTRKKQDREGLLKKVRSNPPLRVVFLELTKKCNLRCKHCYVPDCDNIISVGTENQINFSNILNLVHQVDELGVMEIQLTGGEPFVLPYILDVIRKIQSRLIPCSIFTNGTLIGEKDFDYLSNNNYGLMFYISLDGYEETHDTFRRVKGSFRKTVRTIKRLIEMGCDVRINTSVGGHNIKEMPQFIKFVNREFSTLHRLVTVEAIGRAKEDMTINPEEFSDLLRESQNTLEFLDNHDSIVDWSTPACGIGSSMLFIDAYGNVSFCPTLTQRENPNFLAGSIKQQFLKDIWENSPVFKKFRKIQCRDVDDCDFRELCKGGCRSRAYLSTGDINSPDTAMCLLYKRKQYQA